MLGSREESNPRGTPTRSSSTLPSLGQKSASTASAKKIVSPMPVQGEQESYNTPMSAPQIRSSTRDNIKGRTSPIGRSIKPAFVGEVTDIENATETIRQLKIANSQLREERTLLQTKVHRAEAELKKLEIKLKRMSAEKGLMSEQPLTSKSGSNGRKAHKREDSEDITVLLTEEFSMIVQPVIPQKEKSDTSSEQHKLVSGIIPIYEDSVLVTSNDGDMDIFRRLKNCLADLKHHVKMKDGSVSDSFIHVIDDFDSQVEKYEKGTFSSSSPDFRKSMKSMGFHMNKSFRDPASSSSPVMPNSYTNPKPLTYINPKSSSTLVYASTANFDLPQAKRKVGTETEEPVPVIQEQPSSDGGIMEGLSLADSSVEYFKRWWKKQPLNRHYSIARELFCVIKESNQVFDLMTQITFAGTIREVVTRFKAGSKDILRVESVVTYMVQSDNRLVVYMEENDDEFPTITIGTGLFGKSLKSGEVTIIQDVKSHPEYRAECDCLPNIDLNSSLIIPLADRTGQIYATAIACNKINDTFEKEDAILMQALVDLLSNCLQQFKLLERAQRAQQRNKAISEVLKAVHNQAFTMDDVISKIIQLTYEVIVVDRVSLFLVDNIAQELLLKVSKDKAAIRVPIGVGIAGIVAKTGEIINIRDAYKDARFDQQFDRKSGYKTRTILCLPILDSNKKPVAIIQLINKATGFFTREDEDLMATFTAEAASALQQRSMETAYNNLTTNSEAKSVQHIKGLLDEYLFQRKPVQETLADPRPSLSATTIFSTAETLEGLKDWNLDHFSLSSQEIISLVVSGFESLGLLEQFQIDHHTFLCFLDTISKHYRENPYHNFAHAFSVFQCCFLVLTNTIICQYLMPSDILSLLVAALCHDLDHPGTNNMFMINSESPLAIIYNDISVLENHHCAITFRLLQNPETNILSKLTPAQKMEVRKTIIPAILATDMSEHAKMTTALSLHQNAFDRDKKEDRQFLVNVVLHSGDLCNPVLPNKIAHEWASRVLQEFNSQAKKEKEMSLPVASFMENSDEVSKAHLNIGFIRYIVSPLWVRLAEVLPGLDDCIKRMNENLKAWELITNPVEKTQ